MLTFLLSLVLLLIPTPQPAPKWEWRATVPLYSSFLEHTWYNPDKHVFVFTSVFPPATTFIEIWDGFQWQGYSGAAVWGATHGDGVYDQQRNRLISRLRGFHQWSDEEYILWGERYDSVPNDEREYDGWENIFNVPESLQRLPAAQIALTYDSNRHVTYVFNFTDREAWEYDGMHWTLRDTIPDRVEGRWAVYDPARRVVWLPNMWSWDGSKWRPYITQHNPSDLGWTATMYGGRIVIARGEEGTWEWDGWDWHRTISSPLGYIGPLIYNPDRNTVLAVISLGEDATTSELWEYGYGIPPTPTPVPTPTATPTITPTPSMRPLYLPLLHRAF